MSWKELQKILSRAKGIQIGPSSGLTNCMCVLHCIVPLNKHNCSFDMFLKAMSRICPPGLMLYSLFPCFLSYPFSPCLLDHKKIHQKNYSIFKRQPFTSWTHVQHLACLLMLCVHIFVHECLINSDLCCRYRPYIYNYNNPTVAIPGNLIPVFLHKYTNTMNKHADNACSHTLKCFFVMFHETEHYCEQAGHSDYSV